MKARKPMKTARTKQRLYRVLLGAILTASLMFAALPVTEIQAAPQSGENTGAETDTTQTYERVDIYTLEDLQKFSDQCHVDSWSADKEVHLMADLSLADVDFEPISVFNGFFYGENHTISGFVYEGTGYVTGLFRYIGHAAEIRDLRLEAEISSNDEKECVGGLVGVNYGTIRNCTFAGTVDGKNITGGIAGINESTGLISDSMVMGRITGYYATGGVAGKNHGMIMSTQNQAGINDDTEWVEQDDEMGLAWLRSVDGTNSNVQIHSGVDTGGIAGCSDGYIGLCTNAGRVGYEHTGYNVGGIAGRQAGMVDQCTNNGTVNGRKDVGGIVGQMEPYIELNEAESLRSEVNKLHDLIQKTIKDMQSGKNVVQADTDRLLDYSQQTLDTGKSLADQMSDFADSNMDAADKVSQRVNQVMNMVPNVLNQGDAMRNRLNDLNNNVKKAIRDLNVENRVDSSQTQPIKDRLEADNNKLQKSMDDLDVYMQKIQDILQDDSLSNADKQTKIDAIIQSDEFQNALSQVSSDLYDVLQDINDLMAIYGPALDDALQDGFKDLENASKNGEDAISALGAMSDAARAIVNYINAQEEIRFTRLGEQFDQDRQTLYDQLSAMNDCLQSISDDTSHYSDVVTQDLLAVNDQINVVFNLLMDQLDVTDDSDATSIQDSFYQDVSDEQLEESGDGWIENSRNKGIVNGDINVGGIAGSMAIDEEDPEENAAGNVDYTIGNRYVTRCVIRSCVNEGYITAKKDGAGGVAGYMKIGAVVNSESYGSVESTEGDFVGGICGQSLSVIRSCYAISDVSGGKNVGGIAGYAEELTDCCSLARVEAAVGQSGAIAGQVSSYEKEEDEQQKVKNNFFAGDALYGIDGISYDGIAQSISYEEMLEIEGIPQAFRHLKITYRTEDQVLGYEEVAYGDSLDHLTYPEIPEKEGYYGVWEDVSGQRMTGNRVLEAEYVEKVSVVQSDAHAEQTVAAGESDEKRSPRKKPYALVESSFTGDAVLHVSTDEETGVDLPAPEGMEGNHRIYFITLENADVQPDQETALRLYNPYGDDVELWHYEEESGWQQEELVSRGEYLQTTLTGDSGIYCIVEKKPNVILYAVLGGCSGGALLLLLLRKAIKKHRQKRQEKSNKKNEENEK